MKQELQNQLLEALEQNNAEEALRQVVLSWKASGMSQQEVLGTFDEFLDILRSHDEEQKEDILLNVMDYIVGWCRPGAQLF